MRILTSMLIWVVLVGGMALYMKQRTTVEAVAGYRPEAAPGVFRLEATLSFTAAPDPFALDPGDDNGLVVLRVRVNGVEAISQRESVAAGSILSIEPAPGLIAGMNEFYVEASPPIEESDRPHAVRVRVFRNGDALAEHTLWSAPGGRIAGVFDLELPGLASDEQ